MGHQFDKHGADDFPELSGVALLLDIAAILGCGALAMFAALGMAVTVMSISQ